MNKKILTYMVCFTFLTGCASESAVNTVVSDDSKTVEETVNVTPSEEPDSSDTLYIGSDLDVKMPESVEDVAIIRIRSIDAQDNINHVTGQYTPTISSYGSFEVLRVYKGGLQEHAVYPFVRWGGTILYEDYLLGLNEQAREKQIQWVRETQATTPTYVHENFLGGIDIEEDGVYFCWITPSTLQDTYFLGSFMYDFMEVDKETLNSESVMVFDSVLNEWKAVEETGLLR